MLRLIRRVVELEPFNFTYQTTLGLALYRRGHYQEAVGCLEATLPHKRENPAFSLYCLALAYHRLGDAAKARDFLNQANLAAESGNPTSMERLDLAAFRTEAEGVLGIKKEK
jgi:tetratricopeptide (TPR) repeat protein